jgi:hypothetical protein
MCMNLCILERFLTPLEGKPSNVRAGWVLLLEELPPELMFANTSVSHRQSAPFRLL